MTRHYHGDYAHEHDGGETPHGHGEVTARVEEPTPAQEMDAGFAEDIGDTILSADNQSINETLRKHQSETLAKALRKDAQARSEAVDATQLAVGAAVRDDLPPDTGLEAEKQMATAVRHKADAQALASMAEQISSAITEPVAGAPTEPAGGGVTELAPVDAEPESQLPPAEEGTAPPAAPAPSSAPRPQRFRMGRG